MSDLQIGLVALGVLLILGVLGFNWWQDRRARQIMQQHFPVETGDPLQSNATGARREPEFVDSGDPVPADWVRPDDPQDADPACEVVIDVVFTEPIRGTDLTAHWPRGLHDIGGKPVRLFAKTVDGGHRARLHEDERYVSLQFALLLANRRGPISAIEWSHFWGKVERFAERFDATIEGPEQAAVIEQASRLDEFCAQMDLQVGLTLVMNSPQPAPAVLAVAREIGFSVDAGRLLWMSDVGLPRFSVARSDGDPFDERVPVDSLTMLLDMPLSPPDEHPFGRLAQVGRELAARLDAQLVDDQGKPVQEGSERLIDEQLRSLYDKLEQAGMTAGSDRAARVFS